ncbi:hypothetical protein BCU68_07960 [Vibrio sp. 10N.286.49.B3]|uniref:helix-turn-helix domain-containing protein n=1 Tax=Vibrio sp. 10N.286.49.B3 TaxID=1880855 RepID=UPI000C847A62|nr:AraC family transcriptional regulator [Vibrio sp. 10N.286.49.B3]PMH37540.1 hypothetical protein BCU68_07960 [Vibrio sp. 10N.286.49.B3]
MTIKKQSTNNVLITSSANIYPFIEYCEQNSINWHEIAQECNLPTNKAGLVHWLPLKDLMQFLHCLEKRYGYTVGIEVGRLVSMEQLSPTLAKKIRACDSLESGIQCLIAELTNLNNHIMIWTEKVEDQWWLCHRSCYQPSSIGFEQSEWFRSLTLISFCRHFLGENWRPHSAKLSSSSDNHHQLPESFKQTSIEYGLKYGAIAIDVKEDFQPISQQEAENNWHQAVTTLIRTYASLPWMSIDWFAKMLGMTKRTLQRKLKQENIIFKSLKENAKKEKAIYLVINSDLPIHDIAEIVGYSDLSNFNRAFKGWTSMGPPTYRKTHRRSNDES